MIQNIIFGVCVTLIVAGGIFAWWVENRSADADTSQTKRFHSKENENRETEK